MNSIFSKYKAYLFLAILTMYAMAQVFSMDLQNKPEPGPVEQVILWITAPPQEAFSYVIHKTHQMWLGYFYLVELRKDYRDLSKRHRALVLQLPQLKQLREENERLRRMLGFKEQNRFELLPARVIAVGTSTFTKSVRINRGAADGVTKACAVVTAQGVVGQVVETTQHYANVMLLLDPNSSIGAIVQRTRSQAILQGSENNFLRFKYLPHDADVHQGDIIVASGLDSIYPKGLPIGHVMNIKRNTASLFLEAFVEPATNFERLEEVFVILNQNRVSTTMAQEAGL